MKNNSIDSIYDLVKEVSHLEDPDIVKKGLKLAEEVGELSAEILKLTGYKYTNPSDVPGEEVRNNLLEEAVDSLIMVFDILVNQGYTKEEIIKTSHKKVNKWLSQIENKQN